MCPCALTQWRVHTVSYCGVIIVNMLIIGWLGFKHTQCPPHWLDITRRPHYAFLICHSALCLVTLIGHLCRFIQTGVFSFTHFLHSSHLYSNRVFLWWNTHRMWPFVLSFNHLSFPVSFFARALSPPGLFICHLMQWWLQQKDGHFTWAFVTNWAAVYSCLSLSSLSIQSIGISSVVSFCAVCWGFILFSPVEEGTLLFE